MSMSMSTMTEASYHQPYPSHHHLNNNISAHPHAPSHPKSNIPSRKPLPGQQRQQGQANNPYPPYPPQQREHQPSSQAYPIESYNQSDRVGNNAALANNNFTPQDSYYSIAQQRSDTMLASAPPQMQYAQTQQMPSNSSRYSNSPLNNAPRQSVSSNLDLRRSISSRSGNFQPTSYVALMRKQKATVWCDRAQHEDPRLIAQQRLNKQRAAIEVLGANNRSNNGGRTSTSASGSIVGSNRVTAKIRHHGKAGLVGYSGSENFAVGVGGVPMRLSASEVEGEDDEGEKDREGGMYHHRSGSGRSSLGSGRRGLTYRQSGASSGRWSSGNTPPDSLSEVREDKETPVPTNHPRHASSSSIQKDYFTVANNGISRADSAGSGASGSSGGSERRDEVAGLDVRDSAAARLAGRSLLANTNLVAREKSVRDPEGLRRRGSIDERTHTMTAGRLFVANPDSDSD